MTEVVEQAHGGDSAPATLGEPVAETSAWERALHEILSGVESAQDRLLEKVRDGIQDPFVATLRAATVAGSEALETLRKGVRDKDSAGYVEFWDAIASYRSAVEAEVITLLVRYLRDEKPGRALSGAYQAFFNSLANLAQQQPEELPLQESRTALARRGGEGILLRFRKAIRRGLGSARHERLVPVRLLAEYHLLIRVARRISRTRSDAQYALADLLTKLETASSKWTHAVLDLEQELDAATGLVHQESNVQTEDDTEIAVDDGTVPTERSPSEVLEDVLRCGEELTTALEGIAEDVRLLVEACSDQDLEDIHDYLDYDARAIDTFLLKRKHRLLPAEDYLPASLAAGDDTLWVRYQEQSLNRLRLNQHLLRTRSTIIWLIDSLLESVLAATVKPLRETYERVETAIKEERRTLENLFDSTSDDSNLDGLIKQLKVVNQRAAEGLARVEEELGGINAADSVLDDLGTAESERFIREVDQLPAKLDIHEIDLAGNMVPTQHARVSTVDLKRIVSGVQGLRFNVLLQKPAKQLRRVVAQRWVDVETVANVIAYGAEAAIEEIENAEGQSPATARQVALEGLDRAMERVAEVNKSLEDPWNGFSNAAVRIVISSWNHIHTRVRSEELEKDQFAVMGSRFSVVTQTHWLSLKRGWDVASRWLGLWYRFTRRKSRVLIQKGQSAVGATSTDAADGTLTFDQISRIQEMRASMPLIYRRLFTLDSLQDGAFLENRAADVLAVRSHYERWLNGSQSSTLIVSTTLGSGRTSFLNALAGLVFNDANICSAEFPERIRTEVEAAAAIAKALDVELAGEADFDRLKSVLSARGRQDQPVVCRLYSLEHLVLSVPGGVELIKQLLIFLSRTDHLVYWIGGMSELCHQFLQRTSTTTGFVRFHRLTTFDKSSLEAVVMNRHRRSGLEITFEPSRTPSTLMRQRLNRASTEEERQDILRGAFFERLFRFSGQNLRLALYYWTRSLRFDPDTDSVTVEWPEPLNFEFLNDLDLQRAFSLRSFLFHQTLTVGEHNEIFRMNDDSSIVILESLLNTGLISAHPAELDRHERRIDLSQRYTIHPLMLGPVKDHLVGRHIVY